MRRILIIIFVLAIIVSASYYFWPTQTEPIVQTTIQPTTIPTAIPTPTTPTSDITVTITSVPQGAEISVADLVIGVTPLRYTFKTDTSYQLKATKANYVPLFSTFVANQSTLRLQLVPLNATTLPTPNSTPALTTSPTASNTPVATTAVPFPSFFSLPTPTPGQEFTYTPAPITTPIATSTSQPASSPSPTTTATPIAPQTAGPLSPAERDQYQGLLHQYTKIYNDDPSDPVKEGTTSEYLMMINTIRIFPATETVFSAFPIRFVNTAPTSCTLQAQTDQNTTITIGTIAPNQNTLFRMPENSQGNFSFWCAERPTIVTQVSFFS